MARTTLSSRWKSMTLTRQKHLLIFQMLTIGQLGGEGSKRVKSRDVGNFPDGADREPCKRAMGEELNSLEQRKVHEAANRGDTSKNVLEQT